MFPYRWVLRRYVQEMLKQGYDVLSSDADVAWLRNPLPYFGKLIGLHPARTPTRTQRTAEGSPAAISLS